MKWLLPILLLQTAQASPLLDAVYADDIKEVEKLLDSGTPVNEANRYGVTALSLACLNGHTEIANQLIDAGAKVNKILKGKETPLHTAARTGNVAIVKKLLDSGAQIDTPQRKKQTPLMWAAAEGHTEVVQLLLDRGADFQKVQKSGFTALLFAVRQGHREIAKSLVEAGADVNQAIEIEKMAGKGMRPGTAPLMLAVENGHFELATDLLEAGADPNDQRSGFTPLHIISRVRKSVRGDTDEGLPTPKGSGNMNSLEFVNVLVKHGADPNIRIHNEAKGFPKVFLNGATPFLLAAQTCDLPLMKTLLEIGADHTIPSKLQTTPLLVAAGVGIAAPGEEAASANDSIETIQYLLELGADINAIDERGETVMHAAAYKSAPKVIRLLDELGADINIWNKPNSSNRTPLLITQGFRPGNFRPIATTETVMKEIMTKHGVETPPAPKRKVPSVKKKY